MTSNHGNQWESIPNKKDVYTSKPVKSSDGNPRNPNPSTTAGKCPKEYRWGNDMHLYHSTAGKKGVYKWNKITPTRISRVLWSEQNMNTIIPYGTPYSIKTESCHLFSQPKDVYKHGTLVDIHFSVGLEINPINDGEYPFEGEENIREQEKFFSSHKMFEWCNDKLSEEDRGDGVQHYFKNSVNLTGVCLYNIDNSYRDGLQLTLMFNSKNPMSEGEIEHAIEIVSSFDSDGNFPIAINDKKYKDGALVRIGMSDGYKVTTWNFNTEKGGVYNNLNTTVFGKLNPTKMVTYPVMDANRLIKDDYADIPQYYYSTTKPSTLSGSSKDGKTPVSKPVKTCSPGKKLSPRGKCIKDTRHNPL